MPPRPNAMPPRPSASRARAASAHKGTAMEAAANTATRTAATTPSNEAHPQPGRTRPYARMPSGLTWGSSPARNLSRQRELSAGSVDAAPTRVTHGDVDPLPLEHVDEPADARR